MARQPFDRGATYRAKENFEAMRDSFDATERLVYWMHSQSIYDDKQGWFFFVVGVPEKVRAWDVDGLGDPPAMTPFERIADVHPLVKASIEGRVDEVRALSGDVSVDESYVRVALDVAIEAGSAASAAAIVVHAKLSSELRLRALGEAAVNGKLEVVRALLAVGIPATGEALGRAIWARCKPIVELLIASGADPRKTGRPLEEWIQFLERQNHPEIVEILSRYR